MRITLPVALIALSTSLFGSAWNEWLEAKKADAPLPFPDFSSVGIHQGEAPIPDVKGPLFDVTKYGATPDDGLSDKVAIRKAIAAAKAAGGGVVFFPKGKYILHAAGDDEESIRIDASHIVLRGAGAGPGGTELQYLKFLEIPDPKPMWASRPILVFVPENASSASDRQVTTLESDTRLGQRSVEVADASGLKAGDVIFLWLASTEAVGDYLQGIEAESKWTEIVKKGVSIKERHRIKGIDGNRLTFDEPCNAPMKKAWGVKIYRFHSIEGVGVEDMMIRGNWKKDFVHHRSWEDDAAWGLVNFGRTVDSWIRRVRLVDSCNPLGVSQDLHFSAHMVRIEGNGGHSALGINGSSTACFAGWIDHEAPFWHGPGPSGGANGNVYFRNDFSEKTSVELHASQPVSTLFDLSSGGLIYARDGGAVPNLPNHLGWLMFWNFEQKGPALENYSYWMAKDWGKVVRPWIVGWHGSATTFDEATVGRLESLGKPVEPKSLWIAQLEQRLGRKPAWIDATDREWESLLAVWRKSPPGPLLEPAAATAPAETKESVDGKARHPSAERVWQGPWEFRGTKEGARPLEDFPPTPDRFTLVFRVKMATLPNVFQNLLMREKGGLRDLGLFAKGNLKWAPSYEGETKAASEETKARIDDDKWHLLAFVFDGSAKEARFHVDGKLAAKWTTRGSVVTPVEGPAILGNGLTGAIDYLARWERALDPKEADAETKP